MTRKQRRATFIAAAVATLGLALGLVLFALTETITYFKTPSDLADKPVAAGQRFRLGGLVADGSVRRGQGTDVEFAVTDTFRTVRVTYRGVLPDLFREGQGVVAEGRLEADGRFRADAVLAKHDETYMPPEVAKALKAKGVKLGQGARHPGEKEKAAADKARSDRAAGGGAGGDGAGSSKDAGDKAQGVDAPAVKARGEKAGDGR